MRLIDTHTHLYLPEFEDDKGEVANVVERAVAAGVDRMIFPNVDLDTVEPMRRLAAAYKDNVFMAMGLHPTEVGEDWRDKLAQIESLIGEGHDYVAVGEVGIDLYWDKTFTDAQMQVFEAQVSRAVDISRPVIIHCREGLAQTLEVLTGFKEVKAVFHSFAGSVDDVEAIRKIGDFYFGINGIVTFKNSNLRTVLPAIGKDRLLLETDSPYLAPVPHRGKRNESAYLPLIAAHIAESMGMKTAEIAEATTRNAEHLFNLSR